jgi:hypothetical protein
MAREAGAALLEWNPLIWMVMKRRGLFATEVPERVRVQDRVPRNRRSEQLLRLLRRNFFDRFGRR